MGMLVRLLLLGTIALGVIGGRSLAAEVTSDPVIELVELAGADAIVVDPIALPAAAVSRWIPPVLQGTEEEHPSPEPARVFRPPRASFV